MDKIILITGASRGIGAATARLAADQGYAVCVNYLKNREAAKAIVSEIQAKGGKAIAVRADVSEESEVIQLFKTIDSELGPLSALVNNAGIVAPKSRVEKMDAARLKHMFNSNIVSAFLCSGEAVRRMSTKHGGQGGAIVNVSSRAACVGSANEYVDYAASKAAIDILTKGLATEVADEGIRVNAVRPGLIYTDIHASGGQPDRVKQFESVLPMKRGGQPEEVARAIMWLISEEASYTTGSFIDVSGGR